MAPHITILGGGAAGLTVAHAARKRGLPCTLFEASQRLGGACITFERGPFRFDSGAHRVHDKDPQATREVIDACCERLGNAYPVLDTGCEERLAAVAEHLCGLTNLHLSGRSGRFVYGWIHTMMRFGREIVEDIAGGR